MHWNKTIFQSYWLEGQKHKTDGLCQEEVSEKYGIESATRTQLRSQ